MPEGDTIHRVANRLRPALVGQPLVRFEAPRAVGRPPRIGAGIESVEAVGKHLLITFDDDTVLRTHLRMSGSWHLYRTGERWQKPAHLVRALVAVADWVAVCFQAPVVALEHRTEVGESIGHLGPDLTRADVGPAELDLAVQRMATIAEPDEAIAVVLLDQRIASGIGNVYKSDVLWLCRVDPFAPLAAIDVETRHQLVATASRLLQHNVAQAGRRETVAGGLAVYGNRGRPCRRCGTAVRMRRHGVDSRSTYWCPTCQPPVDRPARPPAARPQPGAPS